jgi:hypothetical protein
LHPTLNSSFTQNQAQWVIRWRDLLYEPLLRLITTTRSAHMNTPALQHRIPKFNNTLYFDGQLLKWDHTAPNVFAMSSPACIIVFRIDSC